VSSSLHSVHRTDGRDELLRRFVEAARRAQIVTIVNQAQTEAELGDLVTAELCEVFDAEVAFILARSGDEPARVVGAHGLDSSEAARLVGEGLLDCTDDAPWRNDGGDLLTIGARALVCAPFGAARAGSVGVVGVARLYDQTFDEAEAALLDAVGAGVEPALERLRFADERDRLYREAEERGQAARVLGSIADGVMLVDEAGIVRLWNPAAEAITGLPRERLVGRSLIEALPGWTAVHETILVASDRRSPGGRTTTVPVDVDGHELWLSIRGVGFAEGTVYAFHDLTEERKLEQLKTDFIATVSHELRTPLSAVHGAAKTLQRNDVVPGDELFGHLLGVISDQSERLARMIDDILLASRVESPQLALATHHVDVAALAAEVLAAASAHAGEDVYLELVGPRTLPPCAADPDKLRQILMNLVANAVKYSPGGGRIEVELTPSDANVTILVRDQGLGIAPSDQPLIFEKFYRVDANMSRGVSGSGLGLYISRALIQRMGGTISVESELGEGSTFVVTLPLASE
jgi:PAS domain S-box-containing protein